MIKSDTLANRFDPKANNFDIIRLLAALLVIFSHSYPLTGVNGDPFGPLKTSGGDIAVAIFFVISGFLITKSLLGRPIKSYLIARALRIFPGMAAALVFGVFIIGVIATQLSTKDYFMHAKTWAYFSNIFLITSSPTLPEVFSINPRHSVNGSLWTIPIETLWYLILPVLYIIKFLNKRTLFIFLSIFLASYAIGVEFFGLSFRNRGFTLFSDVTLYPFLRYGSFFMIGSAYWIYRDYIYISGYYAAILAMLLVAVSFTYMFPAALLLVIPYVVFYIGVSGSFGSKMSAKIGDWSYGVYLYAYPTQQLIVSLYPGISPLELFSLATPFTLVLAAFSWHYIEKPCLSIKQMIITKKSRINYNTASHM